MRQRHCALTVRLASSQLISKEDKPYQSHNDKLRNIAIFDMPLLP
jgi:hypothetical protein